MINIRDRKTQRMLIAAVSSCALVFVILQFLVLPALASWKQAAARTREIRQKNTEMRQVAQTGPEIQKQINAARAALRSGARNIPVPVLGNYLLGMESHLRGCATNVGFNLASVADNDLLEIGPGTGKFRVYRIRGQGRSGFNDFVRLVEMVHGSNPLVSISGLNIMARADSPAAHEISFVVAWLVWSAPAKRPGFLTEKSEN